MSLSDAWPEAESKLSPADLRPPTPCDALLLPTLSRPAFEDYFRGVEGAAPGSGTGQSAPPQAGQKRQREGESVACAASAAGQSPAPRRAWPASFSEYHFTMSILLLEEARATLAGGVVAVSRLAVAEAASPLLYYRIIPCFQALEHRRQVHPSGRGPTISGDRPSHDAGTGSLGGAPPYGMLELVSVAGPSTVDKESDDSCSDDGALADEVDDDGEVVELVAALGDFPRDKCAADRFPTPRAFAIAGMARDVVLIRVPGSAGGQSLPPLLGVVMPSSGALQRVRFMVPRSHIQALRRTLAAHAAKGKSSAGKRNSPCPCVVVKLESLFSSAVEYTSVAAVAYTPFAGLIFRPTKATPTPFFKSLRAASVESGAETPMARPQAMPLPLFESLRLQYNPSQLAAVLAVVSGGSYSAPGTMLNEDGKFMPLPRLRNVEVTTLIGPPG